MTNKKIVRHDDVVLKLMLSCTLGVWMGRYRLGKLGLHIAPNPIAEELAPYTAIPLDWTIGCQ